MDTYAVIHVEEPGADPYWTVVDLSSGRDFRDAHRFMDQQQAEGMAEIMNGKLSEPLPVDDP
jgi:hypothetical protein